MADAKLSFNGSAVETKSVGGGDVRMKLVREELRIETDATLNGQTVEVIVFEDTDGNGSYDNYQVVSVGDGTNSYTLNQLSGSGSDYWLRWDFSTSDLTKAASVNYGDVDNGVGKWDSSGEWDSARSSSGVVHKSLSNTDFGDGSVVNHALPVGSTQNITNGLVGWWPLHTTSGKAPDLSGNGNHGTHNGTTRGVAGKGGLQATSFNSGTADNVDLGASFGDSLFQNGNFTLTVWSRLRSTGRRNIVNYSNDVLSIGYENQGSNGHEASIYDGSFNIVTSGNTTTGEWLFHTLRYDSSATELEYLIDAVSQGTVSAGTPSETDETFRIGNLHFEDRAWDGPIFDFRAYNRLLSDNEIQTLYNWGSTTGVTDPRLHNGSDSGAV
ncbi:MAG: LamG-like jellyroll fold domain-containing protein, partial [Candidatus Nanohaloarchaea archaeon]